MKWGRPCGSDGKESPCNAEDLGWEYPLENPTPVFSILAWKIVDRGAWRATVHEVNRVRHN